MLYRVAQNLMSGLIPVGMLCGICSAPTSASPAASQASAIAPHARQQIRITASVRPIMTIKQQIGTNDGISAFCVWSNSPISQYDVEIEVQRDFEVSKSHLVVQSGSPECSKQGSIMKLLNRVEISSAAARSTDVVILLISPH
jgi:hypothetical protein